MKVVCAPDSFKESMSDAEAAAAMTRGVRSVFPDAQCVEVPMADGGEGIEQVLENASRSVEAGIGGIKIKVGHPDRGVDMTRLTAMREHLGDDFPLMVDANQQWDRPTPCACAGRWSRSTWSGSKSPWTPTTTSATPNWPA